jgi:hypothetical protein
MWAPKDRWIIAGLLSVASLGSNSNAGNSHADGDLAVFPMVFPKDITISELHFAVYKGASTAVGNFRVVIYDSKVPASAVYPGALVYESANIAIDASAVPLDPLQNLTGLSVSLKAGRVYWIGVLFDFTGTNTAYRNLGTSIEAGTVSVLGDDPTRTDLNPVNADLAVGGYKATGQVFPAPTTFPGTSSFMTNADDFIFFAIRRS